MYALTLFYIFVPLGYVFSLKFSTFKKLPSFIQPPFSCAESVQQGSKVYFSCLCLESDDCTGFVEGSASSLGYVCSGYCVSGVTAPTGNVWAVYDSTKMPGEL